MDFIIKEIHITMAKKTKNKLLQNIKTQSKSTYLIENQCAIVSLNNSELDSNCVK